MPKPHLHVSVQCIPSRNRTLKTRFILYELSSRWLKGLIGGVPGSNQGQPMWDLLCAKGHWFEYFFPTTAGCPVSIISGDRDSSVHIATCYWLEGLGIESWFGGEVFSTRPD